MRSLLRRVCPHFWDTTHVNGYGIDMRQKCFCGALRWKEVSKETFRIDGIDLDWSKMEWRWVYSGGKTTKWIHMLDLDYED